MADDAGRVTGGGSALDAMIAADLIRPAVTETGKLKIGGLGKERKTRKGDGTWRPPEKRDYWTVTGLQRDDAGDLMVNQPVMDLLAAQGYADPDGKIRVLPITLHADEIDAVFPTRLAAYKGRKCACSGDGEKAVRKQIEDGKYTGNSYEMDCPCDLLKKGTCKRNGRLLCSLRVEEQSVAGAVHIFRTTSEISINRIVGSLMDIQAQVGCLQGLPLLLRVLPVRVQGGSRTVYVVHVELHAIDLMEAQTQALQLLSRRSQLQTKALAAYHEILALPEPDDDAADIQREHYPEVEEAERAAEAAAKELPQWAGGDPDSQSTTPLYDELDRLAQERGATPSQLVEAIGEAGHGPTPLEDYKDTTVDEVLTALDRILDAAAADREPGSDG